MRRFALLMIFMSFFGLAVVPCTAQKLTENLAKDLVRKATGYPQSVTCSIDVPENSPITQEILKLVQEGYMETGGRWGDYIIKEKGKNLVDYCNYNDIHKYHIFRLYSHKKDIVKIQKILTDSKAGEAVVAYQVDFIPTPYFEKLRSLDTKTIDKAIESWKSWGYVPHNESAYFKKFDQGWVCTRVTWVGGR